MCCPLHKSIATMGRSYSAVSWEELRPSSFQPTFYLPALRVSITAGSFILYDTSRCRSHQSSGTAGLASMSDNNDENSNGKGFTSTLLPSNEVLKSVGRIIEVVDSVENIGDPSVTVSFRDQMISLSQQAHADAPLQYLKVNMFRDHSLISDRLFAGHRDTLSKTAIDKSKWQRLVQLCEYEWIPSTAVVGLSFVFPEADGELVSHTFDDCRGMFNVYLLKHRIDSAGHISCIPHDSCPPFPSCLESYRKLWSVDHCQMIFNGIRQIRQDIQHSLCRVAQSQGDFAVKKTKLLLPSCCWFYIKSSLATEHGIRSVPTVTYSQPKSVLSWGLTLHSSPYVGTLDVIRFDTQAKMDAFRQLFGIMAGFGVRKRRPKYCDGKALLSLNDVLNVISPLSQPEDEYVSESHRPFKLFGATDDGIDLAYDSAEGILQIILRYRKMVVTNASLDSLATVGVVAQQSSDSSRSSSATIEEMSDITPGMEFMDDMYIMQIQQLFSNKIHAKRVYKIVDHGSETSKTVKIHSSDTVIYTDVVYVYEQIQKMLE